MKKTLIVALMASTALTACGSLQSIRESKPDVQGVSNKDAKKLAMCIAEGWETAYSINVQPVIIREKQDGYMVQMPCKIKTCLLADIKAISDQKSEVRMWNNEIWGKFTEATQKCLN